MFGLLVVLAIYVFLGFMLAWIAQIVAREEVEVKTGVIILVLTAVISWAVQWGAGNVLGPWGATLGGTVANFVVLIALLNLIAKLSWKHSAIIAGIYTGLLFLVAIGFGLLAVAASGA